MNKPTDRIINEVIKSLGFEGIEVEGAGLREHGGSKSVTLTPNKPIDHNILMKAMHADDEITTVLLLAFEIEQQLSHFLDGLIGKRSKKTTFDEQISMLRICRFDNDIVDGFRNLRNKFAHNKDASLEKHKVLVKRILECKCLSAGVAEIRTVKYPNESKPIELKELDMSARLTVYAIGASLFLATANQMFNFSKPQKKITTSVKNQ